MRYIKLYYLVLLTFLMCSEMGMWESNPWLEHLLICGKSLLCTAVSSFILSVHLLPRFVFRPIEESAYLFFSQLWRRGVDPATQDPDCIAKVRLGLFRLLRLLVLLGKRGIPIRPFGRILIPNEHFRLHTEVTVG